MGWPAAMPTSAPDPASPALHRPVAPVWQLRLLGAVEARRGTRTITRWPSRAAVALLARLALAPQRVHAREELVELLWPGVALDVGRNRLRQVLSTLKSLLEPADDPQTRPVISADRSTIRLLPDALSCDASTFERLARSGAVAAALECYRGELMPSYYDEWVLEARTQLAALHERVEAQAQATPAATTATLSAQAHPLPTGWTRLFGIEHRATRLLALVRHERLVTVIGPGGSGKTRLAIETARALRDAPDWAPDHRHPGQRFVRIVFVPLVECHDEGQAVAALARALNVSGRDPLQRVQTLLAGAPALLVLDNFEQLAGTAQGLLAVLLEQVPTLHLLVTSRLRLGLPGEQVFALGGLPLPDTDAAAPAAALNPAVALFVDRARAARSDFQLDAQQLPGVCALVRLLDGMPLAIELAASRVRSLSPAQMLLMLGAGDGAHLALLARSGPRAGHDPRHASIADVIDWSWRLLGRPEQRLLAALSVCAGAAGIPGLAAMLGQAEARVASGLDDLVGHSLLQPAVTTPSDVAPRFGLVEPVREFVRAHWPPDDLQTLQQALLAWLIDWAHALGPAAPAAAVQAELDHVHAALGAGVGAPEHLLELALALRSHWESGGLPVGLQSTLEAALERYQAAAGAAASPLASDAHELLAYTRFEAGFAAEALVHAEAALQLAGADGLRRSRALVRRAWVELAAGRSGDDGGAPAQRLHAWLQEALTLARAAGDADAQARALHQMAVVASHLQDDWVGAEDLLAQSQALWQTLGDRRKAQARLRNRGQCWLRLGRTDEARLCFEQCERVAREDGDWVGQIDSLLSLSSLLSVQRQWQASLDIDRRCVALCWQRWHRHGLAYALWNPPRALARLRRPEPAMHLMAFAATHWVANFGPLAHADRLTVKRVRGLVRAQLGQARADVLWAEGAALNITQAVDLALQA